MMAVGTGSQSSIRFSRVMKYCFDFDLFQILDIFVKSIAQAIQKRQQAECSPRAEDADLWPAVLCKSLLTCVPWLSLTFYGVRIR